MERDEIRSYIVEQVAIHIRPLAEELADVKTRLRSLYRNGDKVGAPGFLDMRVEAEDKRYADLLESQQETHKDIQTILLRQMQEDGRAAGREVASQERRVNDKGKQDRVTMWANIILAVVGLLTLALGIATLIGAVKVRSGELVFPHLSSQRNSETVAAYSAAIPPNPYER